MKLNFDSDPLGLPSDFQKLIKNCLEAKKDDAEKVKEKKRKAVVEAESLIIKEVESISLEDNEEEGSVVLLKVKAKKKEKKEKKEKKDRNQKKAIKELQGISKAS